mgnify:CR=1 FL=1
MDLEVHFKGERASAAAEREITALRSIRDELSTDLEVEKAKLKTLEESVENAKTRSFAAGFSEGSSKGVEAYLSSPEYQQRQRDVAAKAVADFLASGDFGRIADARVEAFKASEEFEGLIADRVEKYKSSAEFEELQLTLMQSAGDQIFDRFRKRRPEIDLSFLDESDSEGVEVIEPVQGAEVETVEPVPGVEVVELVQGPEDAEGANAGGDQTAGGDGEP